LQGWDPPIPQRRELGLGKAWEGTEQGYFSPISICSQKKMQRKCHDSMEIWPKFKEEWPDVMVKEKKSRKD
jgi:hypothetical protein